MQTNVGQHHAGDILRQRVAGYAGNDNDAIDKLIVPVTADQASSAAFHQRGAY